MQHLSLRAGGISVSKIADLNRGVLMPLLREVGDFSFTIEIDVQGAEGISKKVIEQQVMETLQQLGARIERKDTD